LPDIGFLEAYAPSASLPTRSISFGQYFVSNLALSPTGYIYVPLSPVNPSTGSSAIKVYSAPSLSLVATITKGIHFPGQVAFDSTGRLYVANGSESISEYSSGSKVPSLVITSGFSQLRYMAIDRSRNLYISSSLGISIYPPGHTKPQRTIRNTGFYDMAFDASNNLYVLHE
jgi:hypothetical protein